MKIKKIEIFNFRGLKGTHTFDFTENNEVSKLIVLDGENGFGKTTIFDAIEFCLTGSIKRLKLKNNEGGIADDNQPDNIIKNDIKEETCIKIFFTKKNSVLFRKICKNHNGSLDDNCKCKQSKYDGLENNCTFEDNDNVLKLLNINEFKNNFFIPQDNPTDLLKASKDAFKKFTNKLFDVDEESYFRSNYLKSETGLIIKIENFLVNLKTKNTGIKDNIKLKEDILAEKSIKLEELSENNLEIKNIKFDNLNLPGSIYDIFGVWKDKEKYTNNDIENTYLPKWKSLLELVQNKDNLNKQTFNYQIKDNIEYINNNKDFFEKNYNGLKVKDKFLI